MSVRVKQVLTVAGVLFVIYTLSRFVVWLTRHSKHSVGWNEAAGYVAFGGIAVVMGVIVFRWIGRGLAGDVLPRALVALVLGCAAAVLIGPFAGGTYPGVDGAGAFFNRVWVILGAGILGGLLGLSYAISVGKDYRTQSLRRYEADRTQKARTKARRA